VLTDCPLKLGTNLAAASSTCQTGFVIIRRE
jgi:hypothetical protein